MSGGEQGRPRLFDIVNTLSWLGDRRDRHCRCRVRKAYLPAYKALAMLGVRPGSWDFVGN